MNWTILTEIKQLADIKELSKIRPQIIFKHSSRCYLSTIALKHLEGNELPDTADFYFLDLVRYRPLSNKIAEYFNVSHESPQVLMIRNSTCVYDESHNGIQMTELIEQILLH